MQNCILEWKANHDQGNQTATKWRSNFISGVDLLAFHYSGCIFLEDNIIVDRFLGQAMQFSVTQNVTKYHFIKKTIEVYHHVEHVFSWKHAQKPM